MSKPIDLIVANVMHDVCEKANFIEALVGAKQKIKAPDVTEATARRLLCQIAHDGHLSVVLEALKSCKAPATLDMIGEGIQAVKDQQ